MSGLGLTILIMNSSVQLAQPRLGVNSHVQQGCDAIEFFNKKINRTFLAKLASCKKVTADTLHKLPELANLDFNQVLKQEYGAETKLINALYPSLNPWNDKCIFQIIQDSFSGVPLFDGYFMAANSIECQWAHVLDFDKETFEVYEGFNQEPLTELDRFYSLQENSLNLKTKGLYFPIKKVHEFSMQNLTKERFKLAFKENTLSQ